MWRRSFAFDGCLAVIGVLMTEGVALRWPALGTPIAGPRPLVYALPLLLDVPLVLRRRAPLVVLLLVLAGLLTQSIVSGDAAEGLELIYPVTIAMYSVAAYGRRLAAVAGLLAWVGAYTVEAFEDKNVQTGQSSQLWAAAFFGLLVVPAWLAGVWVRSRRHAVSLEREATAAVAEERARMARELHDIVSHNLSVVVTQAAGARAAGAAADTLEKIERSGREALVEMRRLLGVLREDGDGGALAPQPGVPQIEDLAANVRATGIDVQLDVDPDCRELPPAVGLAVYRIVQEGLTNALKHARAGSVRVRVARAGGGVRVDVVDDGAGDTDGDSGGHGLVGMRERVALFGGELVAGPRPEGGFAVQATLPLAP